MKKRIELRSMDGLQIPRSQVVDAARRDVQYLRDTHEPECWYAAVVTPQSEEEVVRQLQERGYKAFTTKEIRWRRTHRQEKSKKPIEYPLIPGLVFVGAEDYTALSAIWAMPIIKRFLGSGPLSSRLGTKDLERLRDMSEEADAPAEAQAMISRKEYTIGELCKVIAGPLKGQHFTVEDIIGDGKRKPFLAVVTAQFFNSDRAVELPLGSLVPV